MEVGNSTGGAEYEKICLVFREIAGDFGIDLDDEAMDRLLLLARVIKDVDWAYDSIPSLEDRECFQEEVFVLLETGGCVNNLLSPDVSSELCVLREMLLDVGCLDDFVRLVRQIFSCTEDIRCASGVYPMLQDVLKEGSLTGDLIMVVVGDIRGDIVDLWRDASATGNLVDALIDACEDYSRGEIPLEPGVRFYAEGTARALYGLGRIFAAYPRKRSLLRFVNAIPMALLKYRRK